MTMPHDALACAAAQFIGTPFRLHGRNPDIGLDCVGLIAASLAAIGRPIDIPQTYALRNTDIELMLQCAAQAGLRDEFGQVRAGSIIMVRPGPAQFHLLVADDADGFIHAHAGLRRVVRMPGPLAWPMLRHWRITNEE
ncbi:hypothetical protein GRI44_09815 [Altererythrobacter confluentis]|uniref:NlpC/P60 family protein n=1 Tax=Allopontixanthobacter confluentis TaxID=1849021 RepID=A0A6L7GG62_9SPHN|nr:hypothetical protein [Allopontixanthobacter confluentis]MXP15043.1 hypothetical protein [Allopontixanthobacter confluentis]